MNLFAVVPRGSKYAFMSVSSGASPASELYFVPLDALSQVPIPWRKVVNFDNKVGSFAVHDDDLYLLTSKQTPRYKIIRTNLKNPDLSKAETVFPASEAVVTDMRAARDALYVQTLDSGAYKLWRLAHKNGKPQTIKLPGESSIFDFNGDVLTDGVLFGTDSFTKSETFYIYDPTRQTLIDTKLSFPNTADFSNIVVVTAKAKSHDGISVPMIILHKRGLNRDGTNPTLITGYGAYGLNHLAPTFRTNTLAWLERGGVLALAGARGGGEYGEEWHVAGFQKTKPSTWKDFIACAEYLIHEKYTSPQHLAGQGASAGGILIGNAIAERPDLFGAAIISVGLTNPLRFETTANGIPNLSEFGSIRSEAGFKSILAMDAYHKIRGGAKYPAVMLTHGVNDPRVEPWMSVKMAARLQAASTSGKPVLLRTEYAAGHTTSSRKQANQQQADIYAFIFQQLGTSNTNKSGAPIR